MIFFVISGFVIAYTIDVRRLNGPLGFLLDRAADLQRRNTGSGPLLYTCHRSTRSFSRTPRYFASSLFFFC